MAVDVDCLCLRRMRGKAKGRSRGEGSGDAPASLSHRISAISGPSVGCSLTGVARDALPQPASVSGWLRIPSQAGGLEPCLFLPRGPTRLAGAGPNRAFLDTHRYSLASPFFVLDFLDHYLEVPQVPVPGRGVALGKNAAGASFLTRFKICGGPTVSDWGRAVSACRFNSFVLCCFAKCSQFDSRLRV